MVHSREQLLATLDELRQQLADAEGLDPAAQQRLEDLVADVQSALDRPAALEQTETDSAKEEQPSLVEQLTDAARHFEESHPTLFGTLGSVINALSRMGI